MNDYPVNLLLHSLKNMKRKRSDSWQRLSSQGQQHQRKRARTSISTAWGRFHRLYDPIGNNAMGKFWYSTRMIREKEDAELGQFRVFCIIRYTLDDATGSDSYGYQLFYRSSGHNSVVGGTWYPCDGLMLMRERQPPPQGLQKQQQEKPRYSSSLVVTMYQKLSTTKFSGNMKNETQLIRALLAIRHPRLHSEETIREYLLIRFGTLKFMYASYLLGGGIWSSSSTKPVRQNHYDSKIGPILGGYFHFDAETPFVRSLMMDNNLIKHIPVIKRDSDLNQYTKFALSRNYLKDEYPKSTTWVDLREWLKPTEVLISAESAAAKAIRRLTRKEPPPCYGIIPLIHDGESYIIVELYENDLNTIDCNTFAYYKKKYQEMIDRGDFRL